MAKNWQVRLNETIVFIDKHAADKKIIARALRNWNTTAPLQYRKALSEKMSQNGVPNRPKQNADRSYRRAIILMECALELPAARDRWDATVTKVNKFTSNYSGWFKQSVDAVYDIVRSDPAYARHLIDKLTADPLGFLSKHRLVVAGKGASGVFGYCVYSSKGNLKIDPNGRSDMQYRRNAINVPAQNYADVQDNLATIDGTNSRDYDCALMLTTQFTGCSFCFSVAGGSLVAAHINPGGAPGSGVKESIKSTHLPNVLREHGGFRNGNGGDFQVYGRTAGSGYEYPQENVTQMVILATRTEENWHVYAQQCFVDNRLFAERID